jgi:predicted TIM-barrel fold metal-dependent hydrolase
VLAALEELGIARVAELLRDDILFCATDFPHEPRAEFHENIQKFMAREDLSRETKRKITTENPLRMYPLAAG